ncbi:MAG: hypothetical protein Fur0037_15560 [Planctomycetota bacterium]
MDTPKTRPVNPAPELAPEASRTADYVLPKAPRERASLFVDKSGQDAPGGVLARADLASLGRRMSLQVECQQQLLSEARTALAEIDANLHEDTKARIKARLARVAEVLDFCDAAEADLLAETRLLAAGKEPLDLGAAVEEAAAAFEARSDRRVFRSGDAPTPFWASRSEFARLLESSLDLVSARTSEPGPIGVEIEEQDGRARIRFLGIGEPRDLQDSGTVAPFRRLVARLGIRVAPDRLGPGGTGFVLLLPGRDGD